jgi:hypothetical protein
MASVKNRVAGLIMAGVVTATVGTNIPNSYDEPQAQDGRAG